MYKVTCGSTVDHLICFDCEKQWREKMPVRDGERKMTCPTCRQPESTRTVDSLERELKALYVTRPTPTLQEEVVNAYQLFLRIPTQARSVLAQNILASTRPRPPSVLCASGRDCQTRSRSSSRAKTHLMCRRCREVACCNRCVYCLECLPSSSDTSSVPSA